MRRPRPTRAVEQLIKEVLYLEDMLSFERTTFIFDVSVDSYKIVRYQFEFGSSPPLVRYSEVFSSMSILSHLLTGRCNTWGFLVGKHEGNIILRKA
jgi:hypothetical protein